MGEMETALFVEEPESCCLLELRAAKRRFCCCGVKRKFGGKLPPVPVEAIASDVGVVEGYRERWGNYLESGEVSAKTLGWISKSKLSASPGSRRRGAKSLSACSGDVGDLTRT